MEVSKTFGDPERLRRGVRNCVEVGKKRTYKINEVCVPILLYIVPQLSTGHPFRDKLRGIERDPLERYDIWVIQVFPHHSLFAEQLRGLSGDGDSTGGWVNMIPL